MSTIDKFQKDVNNLLGDNYNFQIDRAHAGKDTHVDLTVRLPQIGGADKVDVDFNGNIIEGSTFVGKTKLKW